MQLTVLGTGSGGPFQGRNFTAQILKIEGETYLIDCGEGTQHQLYHHRVRYDGLNQIFISHLHGDHVFGLMGLLTSFSMKKRTQTLTIFAPEGLRELIETTSRVAGVYYSYPLEVVVVDTTVHQKVFESNRTEVWSIPLNHRTLCSGWLFREKTRQPNMRAEMIEAHQIPFSEIKAIKAGGDFAKPDGTVVPHHELTTPPPTPRSFAFCSDTAFSPTVVECVHGVGLLYHEATFTNDHLEEAAYTGHSTAEHAAQVAAQAGVGRLLLGHFSARYQDESVHVAEAKRIFEQTEAAVEGGQYEV
jgi:ribonuclease Z